jgi:glutaredoxin
MQQVPVMMYTTSWCKVCDRARAFFRVNGVRVVEKDVDASPSASREQRGLNPSGSVPTIKIDERVFVGFSEQELTRALVTSAIRRLEAR